MTSQANTHGSPPPSDSGTSAPLRVLTLSLILRVSGSFLMVPSRKGELCSCSAYRMSRIFLTRSLPWRKSTSGMVRYHPRDVTLHPYRIRLVCSDPVLSVHI